MLYLLNQIDLFNNISYLPLNYCVKFSVIKLQKMNKKNSQKLVEEANALIKTLKVRMQ